MPDRMEEPLDFPQILNKQIWAIANAKNDNDVNKYIRSVENFEDLLIAHIEGDKEYENDIKAATDGFNKQAKGLRHSNPDDAGKINRARELFSRAAFRSLIRLINRAGFLPRKEIEGVISEYDGKLIEKLHELEKEGRKEVSEEEIEKFKDEIIEEEAKKKFERMRKQGKISEEDETKTDV